MSPKAVLEVALQFQNEERADVAAELLASLDGETVVDAREVERAWAAEIERRARRILAGESAGAPWEEVKQRLEERLAE